jgi:hypothetical protein
MVAKLNYTETIDIKYLLDLVSNYKQPSSIMKVRDELIFVDVEQHQVDSAWTVYQKTYRNKQQYRQRTACQQQINEEFDRFCESYVGSTHQRLTDLEIFSECLDYMSYGTEDTLCEFPHLFSRWCINKQPPLEEIQRFFSSYGKNMGMVVKATVAKEIAKNQLLFASDNYFEIVDKFKSQMNVIFNSTTETDD